MPLNRRRLTRTLLGALWLVSLTGGCAARVPAKDAAPDITTAAPDAEVAKIDATGIPDSEASPDGVTPSAADATDTPDNATNAGDAASDVPPPVVSAFHISLPAGLAMPQGRLHVRLVNEFDPVNQPTANDDVIFDGAMDLPATVTGVIPNGVWWPVAALLAPDDTPLISTINCDVSGTFTVSPSQPAPSELNIVLNTPGPMPACSTQPPPSFLSGTSSYVIPVTDTGVTHLLEGLAWNGAWWMAANVDGIARVDLPGAGKSLGNWQSMNKAACRHIARRSNRLFCSQRNAEILWMDIDPATSLPSATGVITLPVGMHAEGIAIENDLLFASLHEHGLAVVPLAPVGPPVVYAAKAMSDVWHVAALGNGNLVLANGAAGIAIVQPQGATVNVLATLPLPGLSAHLSVEGNVVAVGALGGGLHLVDVSVPTAPVLLGSLLAGPWPIVGVELHNGTAYAAAVRGVLAVPVPSVPVAQLAASALTLTQKFMTLDVRVAGDALVTAEYALVRSLALGGAGPATLPIAMTEAQTWSNVVAVGKDAQYITHVWNPGGATLHISNLKVMIAPPQAEGVGAGPPLPFTAVKSLAILPGQTAAIAVSVTKTAPGIQNADLRFQTDDPHRPFISVRLTESPFLTLGQPLPPLAYKDGSGTLVDVAAQLKGKPALLILTAESCPVAMERTAALFSDYAAAFATGGLAVMLINVWDLPSAMEYGTIQSPFPELFTPLTTPDNAAYSTVADGILALPGLGPIPPLPHVYVLDAAGKMTYAHLGYAPGPLKQAVAAAIGP